MARGRCIAPDGSEIEFDVSGDGPMLVFSAWWVSHLELDRTSAIFETFFDELERRYTVVRYDRPGVGLSGGARSSFTLDDEVQYLSAVVDAVADGPVSLFGTSCGGPPAVVLSVRRPDDVERLVLYGSYVDGSEITREDSRAALVDLVRANWGFLGSRTLADVFRPEATREERRAYTDYQRDVASPEVAAGLLGLTFDMDVRNIAAEVTCPTLVLHRAGDLAVPVRCGRALAEAIPDAELSVLPGDEHAPSQGDVDRLLRKIDEFLLGGPQIATAQRRLRTVLFTDIVGSTGLAEALGDDAWRARLDQHDSVCAATVADLGGTVVKTTGDGIVATFDLPTAALSAARDLHRRLRSLGLAIRCGVHTGEIEMRGDDIAGVAVNIAARVESHAGPGETRVTSTVRELSAGSPFVFDGPMAVELRGVSGEWTLYRVS